MNILHSKLFNSVMYINDRHLDLIISNIYDSGLQAYDAFVEVDIHHPPIQIHFSLTSAHVNNFKPSSN